MTVFLTQDVVSALPITTASPYLVALTNSGLVVGSASLATEDVIDGQQYLAIWGDDTETSEIIDGALAGEVLSFQLVDGDSLYDLDITFAGVNAYTTNGVLPAIGVSYNFNCSVNFGCMDANAFNYDEEATIDDGSCVDQVNGCTDDSFIEFNPLANVDDGSCVTDIVYGCTTAFFIEYDENANVDDGSCQTIIFLGCTDSNYIEYNIFANTDDGSCLTLVILGCTDASANNFNAEATDDDGSCDYGQSNCVFPEEWEGNTGVNMTVFLTQDVVSALPITSASPYLVALTNSGLVVGSASLATEDVLDGQLILRYGETIQRLQK